MNRESAPEVSPLKFLNWQILEWVWKLNGGDSGGFYLKVINVQFFSHLILGSKLYASASTCSRMRKTEQIRNSISTNFLSLKMFCFPFCVFGPRNSKQSSLFESPSHLYCCFHLPPLWMSPRPWRWYSGLVYPLGPFHSLLEVGTFRVVEHIRQIYIHKFQLFHFLSRVNESGNAKMSPPVVVVVVVVGGGDIADRHPSLSPPKLPRFLGPGTAALFCWPIT